MRSSYFLCGVVVLASLFFVTHVDAFVNGQPGDSDWTIASDIGQDLDEVSPAFPTLIFQTDFVGGVGGTYTITQAGNYKLSESVNGRIRINTGGVTLDLNDYEVVYDATVANIIEVQSGADDVTIYNGIVRHSGTPPGTWTGIRVNAVSHAVLRELVIIGCEKGIYLNGATDSKIESCKLLQNSWGIRLASSNRCFIHACDIIDGLGLDAWGVHLYIGSNLNVISHCRVIDLTGTNSARGFEIEQSDENLLINCIVKNVRGPSQANGISVVYCNDNKVIDCLVNGVSGPGFGIGITSSSTDNLIMGNKVYNCSGTGYSFTSNNLFIQNVAYNNGTNYTGIPNTIGYNRTLSSNPTIILHNADIS